jgi:diphosphomevalonate decarboxylase
MTTTEVSMPTNIALIKYMGKKNSTQNIPSNASLSYTLNHLQSTVYLTEIEDKNDQWDSQSILNEQEKNKFVNHLNFLREKFNIKKCFKIHSENNFPTGCGLASSASSFAALTKCAISAFGLDLSIEEISSLSRRGSGSSCRSFFSPWALWKDETVEAINLPYQNLYHQVIVVSKNKKAISSSEAHLRVQSSQLFIGREKRAEIRLENLLKSFESKEWGKSYKILWQEFWDMHALFETAEEPFGYLLPDSLFVLNYLKEYWQINHDGPLITMDAGPNIHLLFREDQQKEAEALKAIFSERFLVLY